MFLQSHSRVPRADGEDFGEAGETRTVDEQRRGRYSVTSNKFFFFFSLWQNRLLNERFRGRSPVGAAVVHFMVNFKDCLSWADGTA